MPLLLYIVSPEQQALNGDFHLPTQSQLCARGLQLQLSLLKSRVFVKTPRVAVRSVDTVHEIVDGLWN